MTGNIMKKYRFAECSRKEIGVTMNLNQKCRKKDSLSRDYTIQMRQNFERNDVSRVMTKKKQKKTEKRLLFDTVENVH